eukprot:scaffold9945_cov182-Amphora_coffeaeformis.AAC.5
MPAKAALLPQSIASWRNPSVAFVPHLTTANRFFRDLLQNGRDLERLGHRIDRDTRWKTPRRSLKRLKLSLEIAPCKR